MIAELDPDDPDQFLQIIENDTEFKDMLKIFKDSGFNIDKKRQERQFVMERTDFEKDEDKLSETDLEGLTAEEIAALQGTASANAVGGPGVAEAAAGAGVAGAGGKGTANAADAAGAAGIAGDGEKEAATGDKRIKVLKRMADKDK